MLRAFLEINTRSVAATSNDDVDALVMEVAEAELRLKDIAERLRAPSTDIRHQSAPGDLALIGERNGAVPGSWFGVGCVSDIGRALRVSGHS